jgi:hypothetical protein
MNNTSSHPSALPRRDPRNARKSDKALPFVPSPVRAAVALLRRYAEREPNQLERERLVQWVDHLAYMLTHPYYRGAE